MCAYEHVRIDAFLYILTLVRYFHAVGPGPHGAGRDRCHASEEFEWLLGNGKRIAESGSTPCDLLTLFLRKTCPGWQQLCEPRWRSGILLNRHGLNMDLAFLEGFFRYSHAVGPAFQCGLRVWPPPDNYGEIAGPSV
jgi:hypothetical protein